MRLWFAAAAAVVPLLSLLPAAARADLNGDIAAVLQDKVLAKATCGIKIERLGKSPAECPIIYERDAATLLTPASNLKVLTTSAALDRFGPDFKFQTKLATSVDGDIAIIGDGDPTFGDAELYAQLKCGWDVTTIYQQWAAALKARGVTSVRNVIVDDGCFDQTFVHPDWPADQITSRYMAGVGGVNLNANCIDLQLSDTAAGKPVGYQADPPTKFIDIQNLCVGGSQNAAWYTRGQTPNSVILRGESPGTRIPLALTVEDPPLYAATVLAETLASQGIRVTGQMLRDRTVRTLVDRDAASTWHTAAVNETPLSLALQRANKDSMNLYAESLCKRLGYASTNYTAPGDWQNGPAAVTNFVVNTVGVPAREIGIVDGCGLSKQDKITADCMLRVLTFDYFSQNRQAFIASLAIAGQDGTLDDRFRDSDLRGRLFGKSGFVNGVSCLSGYWHGRDDNWYAFSILMNGIPAKSNSSVKPLQERILMLVENAMGRG